MSLPTFIGAVRGLHIAAGAVALASFAVPLLAPKGGRTHRSFGWCFVAAIGVVAATALAACAYRLLTPSASPEARRVAVFFGYLSLLSANSARTGLRALRFKSRRARHDRAVDFVLPGLLGAAGAALAAWGFLSSFRLAAVFGIVGVLVAARQIRYWLTEPSTPRHWMYQHMQSMVGGCVATLTAFLVVNARALGVPPSLHAAAWLGPTLLGLPGVLVWSASLRAKERASLPPVGEGSLRSGSARLELTRRS